MPRRHPRIIAIVRISVVELGLAIAIDIGLWHIRPTVGYFVLPGILAHPVAHDRRTSYLSALQSERFREDSWGMKVS